MQQFLILVEKCKLKLQLDFSKHLPNWRNKSQTIPDASEVAE